MGVVNEKGMSVSSKTKKSKNALLTKHPTCIDDSPNKLAHLGVRFAYTCIAWVMLGVGVSVGNAFFVSIFLFALPLLMDYFKFDPEHKIRKWFKRLEILIVGFWALMGIFGAFGAFEIVKIEVGLVACSSDKFIALKNLSVPVDTLWYFLGTAVFITAVDWVFSITPLEVDMNKLIKNKGIAK